MNNIINYNAAALKEKIDKAIEEGRTQDADQLVLQLLELEEFDETTIIPDNFVQKIIWCGRKDRMKRKVKIIKTAAICLALLLGISGTTYASVKHLKQVEFFDYGFISRDQNSDYAKNMDIGELKDKGIQEDQFVADANEKIKVTDAVQGTKDTKWISKTSSIVEMPSAHWEGKKLVRDNEPDITYRVQYNYSDYEKATDDCHMPKLLTKDTWNILSVKDIRYREESSIQGGPCFTNDFKANFSDEKGGQMRLYCSKEVEGNFNNDMVYTVSWKDKSTNQRRYTAKDGTEYALCDGKIDGIPFTVTMQCNKEYLFDLLFNGMSNDKIEQILDTIDMSALNK